MEHVVTVDVKQWLEENTHKCIYRSRYVCFQQEVSNDDLGSQAIHPRDVDWGRRLAVMLLALGCLIPLRYDLT